MSPGPQAHPNGTVIRSTGTIAETGCTEQVEFAPGPALTETKGFRIPWPPPKSRPGNCARCEISMPRPTLEILNNREAASKSAPLIWRRARAAGPSRTMPRMNFDSIARFGRIALRADPISKTGCIGQVPNSRLVEIIDMTYPLIAREIMEQPKRPMAKQRNRSTQCKPRRADPMTWR